MNKTMWKMLATLFKRYGQVRSALKQMCTLYPKNAFLEKMQKGLSQGHTLKELLKANAFEKQVGFYSEFMDGGDAINLVLDKKEKEGTKTKRLLNKLGYPMFILLLSCVMLTFFNSTILPQTISQMNLTTQRTQSVINGFSLMNAFKNILLILLLLLASSILLIVVNKKENIVWILLHRMNMDGLIQKAATSAFAQELLFLCKRGVSLDKAIEAIRFADRPLVSLLAYHFNEKLNEGIDLQTCLKYELFDRSFYDLCLYGLSMDNFEEALQDYIIISGLQQDRLLDILSFVISAVGYLMASAVIVMGYEVMLLPLEILEGF